MRRTKSLSSWTMVLNSVRLGMFSDMNGERISSQKVHLELKSLISLILQGFRAFAADA
jgi:hypothetical protein